MDKILIIEDEINLAHILKSYFEKNNYIATYAENGEIAKKWIDEMRPDLIIIDIILPDINGIEIAKRIRENIKTRKIPIIIITGKNEIDLKIKSSVEAHANLFLTKPFEPAVILEASKKLIEEYKQEKYRLFFNKFI